MRKWLELGHAKQALPELALLGGVLALVAFLVVPLPAWMLDLGLACNLAASVLLLLAALHVRSVLQLTIFPSLLLLTTLGRLGLSVSSTRLALSEGHAGEVVQAFGGWVIRGEYVVGLVVFGALTVVQFIVVAKGAERVAEVSARFFLDGLPGKQMSIDADLRAGSIDAAQARSARLSLERESQLFGAMDGAMKFVKGDVIAGLVLLALNLVGGTALGALQHGMGAGEAFEAYALMAVGEGLIAQLGSLCVTVGAGLLVTRVASASSATSLAKDIAQQLLRSWPPFVAVGALCLGLAALPGMPGVAFLAPAMLYGAAAAWAWAKGASAAPEAASGTQPGPARETAPTSPAVAPVSLELSAGLFAAVQAPDGLLAQLDSVRRVLWDRLGLVLPPFAVSELGEGPERARLLLEDVPCAEGRIDLEAVYVASDLDGLRFLGVEAAAAAGFGSDAPVAQCPVTHRGRLVAAGYHVMGPGEFLVRRVTEALRRHAAELLTLQSVQGRLGELESGAPALVREVTQRVPLPLLTDVLRRLLEEEVSVRNLPRVLEALLGAPAGADGAQLAELARRNLRRYLSHRHAPEGTLYAYLTDPALEQLLRVGGPQGAIDPERVAGLLERAKGLARAGKAVVLAAPDVRLRLRRLLEGVFAEVVVLTYAELDPALQIRPLGKLGLD